MSKTIIRNATHQDIDWIFQSLKRFSEFTPIGSNLFNDGEFAQNGIKQIIDHHVFFIAEKCGIRAGVIAGFLVKHFMNPKITVLTEYFWWVDEEFRKTRVGFMLLNEFIKIGKEKADWILMSLLANSPVRDETLEHFGFEMQEKSFLLKKEM